MQKQTSSRRSDQSTGVDTTCTFPSLDFFAPSRSPSVLASGGALAAYPEKPITIVVPTAAGGANDAMARVVGQAMSAILKQPVIVDNKRRRQRRDRQRVRQARETRRLHADAGLHRNARHEPVAAEASLRPGQGFRAGRHGGLLGYADGGEPHRQGQGCQGNGGTAQGAPDKIAYASAGNGTAPHFAAEMFKLSTGTKMLHVPYKGSAPAVIDTIGGQTQVMFPSLFTAIPYVKGGQAEGTGRCRREAIGADARDADPSGAGHRRRRHLPVVRHLRAGEDAPPRSSSNSTRPSMKCSPTRASSIASKSTGQRS